MNKLESALVLRLREAIRWDASLDITSTGTVTSTGTLQPVDPTAVFNPLDYQYRDRQLTALDLVNAAAVVDVSIQISDVWNAAGPKPLMEGPSTKEMPAIVTGQLTAPGVQSMVRHVGNTSIPYDAARYADNDLYGRDLLIHEVLACACEEIFVDPPITALDQTGTVVPSTSAWSLAEGTDARGDVNAGELFNRDLFRRADRRLADRDNQLAGYVARVVQALQNPFAYATRLYVRVDNVDEREAETYSLAESTETERVWLAEPALSGRNRITYNVLDRTLTWAREQVNEVHVPQIVALVVPGITPGQELRTLPQVPQPKDAQYWRQKASTIIPSGGSLSDAFTLDFTASSVAQGGYIQVSAASLTVPGQLKLTLPGNLDAGEHRVAVLAVPSPVVEIAGANNTTKTTGIDIGATFEIGVTSIGTKTYLVEQGDGIVYDGNNYYPGDVFAGQPGITAFSQIGSPSKIRQYAMAWNLALPPGAWKLTVDYTNLQYQTTGFGIGVNYVNGSDVVEVIKDVVPAPFTVGNGTLTSTAPGSFDVVNGNEFTLPVYWTYGTGQLHIRKLRFENTDLTDCRIAMNGSINVGASTVDVLGIRHQPEVLLFAMRNDAELNPVLTLNMGGTLGVDPILPVQIKQVTVQDMGTYTPTAAAAEFQGWRQECMDRAERSAAQSFNATVASMGTNFPTIYSSGSSWDWVNTEAWMSLAEIKHPRLREIVSVGTNAITEGRQYEVISGPVTYASSVYAVGQKFYGLAGTNTYSGGVVNQVGAFQKSNPGHIGKPCLIPNGIEFSGSQTTLAWNGTLAVPVVVAAQPWMINAGFYTAQPEFWMPDQR